MNTTAATGSRQHKQARPRAYDFAPLIPLKLRAIKCHANKTPDMGKGWQHKATDNPETIQSWVDAGKLIGVIPGPEYIVIDIDERPDAGLDYVCNTLNFGKPVCHYQTPSGGLHLWYRFDAEHGNRGGWRHEGIAGDVRCTAGYIIPWDAEGLATAIQTERQSPAKPLTAAQIARLPLPSKAGGKGNGQFQPGNRNNDLYWASNRAGETGNVAALEAAKQGALEAGLSEQETEATAKSGWDRGAARVIPAGKSAEGLAAALSLMDVKTRYNVRACSPELNEQDAGWQRIHDRVEADLIERIASEFVYPTAQGKSVAPLRFGADRWHTALNAILRQTECDPFLLWLDELKATDTWDKQPRLDSLLTELFAAEQTELTAWASRYPFIGAIQRGFVPGCRLREIPILIGPQNIGKSAFCKALFPDDSGWFKEGVALTATNKQFAEAVQGAVLLELDELAGRKRADIDHVKSVISRTDDGAVRLAWRRNPEPLPRRCVIVGTANPDAVLPNDSSGNSRFIVVECKQGANIEAYMTANRTQLWLEAMNQYEAGERANLPRELMPEQAELNAQYQDRDLQAEDYINTLPNHCMTLTQIIERNHCPRDLRGRRLADALRQSGWVPRRVRINGRQQSNWYPPDGWEAIESAM